MAALALAAGIAGAAGCGSSSQSGNPAGGGNFTNTTQTPNPPGVGGRSTGTSTAGASSTGTTTGGAPGGGTTGGATPTPTPRTNGDTSSNVVLNADPQKLAFDQTTLNATAGRITITMANPSQIPHDIAFDNPEHVAGKVVGKGGKSTVTLTFPPGRYQYYCSVPGHRQAGMVGTLIVR